MANSQNDYRRMVEGATRVGILVAQDGKIVFVNRALAEVSGYGKEELLRTPDPFQFICPDDRAMVLDRHLKRLQGQPAPETYVFRVYSRDGKLRWVETNNVMIRWKGKPATLNFFIDVTERKRLEAQFQAAQRVEALGSLAGGIAHDFNNLLMGILGNVSLMLMDIGTDHPNYERLKNIEQYVASGSALTRQLLGFARGGKYEVRPSRVNDIIRKTAEMFARTNKRVNLHMDLDENLHVVEVDRAQIEQVLLNLYVNARQAMPGGGHLYLQTRNVVLDEICSGTFGIEPGLYVKISVTDTGMGMDEATRKKVFDPFFTTKEKGRGTGLGLASAYGIVKNHGGMIHVYSEKGVGATFTVHIPASGKSVSEIPAQPQELPVGSGTILLVDDEEMILEIGTELIDRLGYDVLVARGGEEAIVIFEKNRGRIRGVMLDMVMPGMDGGKTYDRLKKIDPEVRVLLCSGFNLGREAEQILSRGCKGFIQKPFSLAQLANKLKEILGDKGE